MLGTIWINIGLGLLAFVVTLVAAGAGNVWLVSLVRAGIAFVIFFIVAFPIRWVIALITHTSASPVGEPGLCFACCAGISRGSSHPANLVVRGNRMAGTTALCAVLAELGILVVRGPSSAVLT